MLLSSIPKQCLCSKLAQISAQQTRLVGDSTTWHQIPHAIYLHRAREPFLLDLGISRGNALRFQQGNEAGTMGAMRHFHRM
jgi:hypothetical protein